MKQLALIVAAFAVSTTVFADTTASSTATWQATATKDTTSSLVVIPVGSLDFQYVESGEAFNTINGAFDVTVQGQEGATDFQLSSKLISNTLVRGDSASTLNVGVEWNGTKLSKEAQTTMINTTSGISAGLDALAGKAIFSSNDRNSAQGKFVFKIDSATTDGTEETSYKELSDGVWLGDVAVQFTATWVKAKAS